MLITLVIIGVVAALTIPNLMQKYTEQTTVKKVQKFYSNLSNAYNLAMKDNGPITEWNLTGYTSESAEKIYEILFKPHFKITKNCGVDNTGNCVKNTSYKFLNNKNWGKLSTSTYTYKITLEDGATVLWRADNNHEVEIYYDTNGPKEPNQWGKDFFVFYIAYSRSIIPGGIPTGNYAVSNFNQTCKLIGDENNNQVGTGSGCTAWIIYKGNMDYLHCDGLTWTSRSCKEK